MAKANKAVKTAGKVVALKTAAAKLAAAKAPPPKSAHALADDMPVIALELLAGTLSPGAQIQTEIVRALWRGGRVLVLDEPTSPLGPAASAHLLGHLRRLRESGLAILLITHRLDEALEVADRVTVLRRGQVTGTLAPDELAAAARDDVLARIRGMMFGDAAGVPTHPPLSPFERRERDASVLRVEGLGAANILTGIDFSIAPGEILGLAGIDGNGQTALAEALAGLVRPTAGCIVLDGAKLAGPHPAVRYLSDDRIGEGTVGALPVALNLILKRIGAAPFWRFGMQRNAAIAAHAGARIADFDIRVPSAWTAIAALSGGNMQKAMLARELDGAPRLIVYHKPTVGLDAHSAEAVHGRIRHAAATGIASLLISADLDEILALCHRVAVLGRGRIVGIVDNGADARRRIAALMTQ